ncbi:hypothetical protein BX600DRAFT_64604 [Xylariales sp. PMI_506]|nr:hypothetical protein BX600DRAFT_64604 [Xylariales sp. PMI_506]
MQPHLSEAWDYTDDWTGVSDARERRRRQNRLHQRAHRKKRRHQPPSIASQVVHKPELINTIRCTSGRIDDFLGPKGFVTVCLCAGSAPSAATTATTESGVPDGFSRIDLIECPWSRQQAARFMQSALARYRLSTPEIRDLPFLSRLNVLRALAQNAEILGISSAVLYDENSVSPFVNFRPRAPSSLGGEKRRHEDADILAEGQRPSMHTSPPPPSLRPTPLQRRVPHHPWLDLIPLPGIRDNILRGMAAGWIEEDLLCLDLIDVRDQPEHGKISAGECSPEAAKGGSGDGVTLSPLVVWGEAWDPSVWELSPVFFQNWSSLVDGCAEVLEVTNWWREKRGQMKIDFVMN